MKIPILGMIEKGANRKMKQGLILEKGIFLCASYLKTFLKCRNPNNRMSEKIYFLNRYFVVWINQQKL